MKFDPGERSPTVSMVSSNSSGSGSPSLGDPMQDAGQWAHDVFALDDPLSMIADVPNAVLAASVSPPLLVSPTVVTDPCPDDGVQHVHVRPREPGSPSAMDTSWDSIDVDAEFANA